jgi:hypothetical protein
MLVWYAVSHIHLLANEFRSDGTVLSLAMTWFLISKLLHTAVPRPIFPSER